MTTTSPGPALSVLLVTPDGYEDIRTTLDHLAVQTIADRMELVVICPDADRVEIPDAIADTLYGIRVVGLGEIVSLARAKAAAVAHASGPVVAFAEDHSFPEPGWAESLLEGHGRGYAGVAPRMENANPDHALSWVAMILHFGGTVAVEGGFESPYPSASHNMSYRRDALLELGAELGERLLAEMFLHDGLRGNGHRLWVEPAAVTRHVNITRWRPLLRHAWIGGRMYGALRYRFGNWSLLRRVAYAGGSPLIPLIRIRRALKDVRRAKLTDVVLPRALPGIIAVLVVGAIGEAAGYLLGMGSCEREYSKLEVRRQRFVQPAERALWA